MRIFAAKKTEKQTEMESNNVRHTTVKPVGEKMVELLDRLQQRKKENLEELSAKMSYFFPAQ